MSEQDFMDAVTIEILRYKLSHLEYDPSGNGDVSDAAIAADVYSLVDALMWERAERISGENHETN
jgi:hypothetical protein